MIRLLRKVFRPIEKEAVESKLEFEAVEPRVLFSATAVDPTETPGEAHHTLPQAQDEAPTYTPARSEAPDVVIPQTAGGDGALLLDGLNAYAPEMAAEGRREIVFISTDVEDYEYIVSNLDSSYEVFLIDSESDGIGQIAAALEGTTGVDAIHLLTHGSEGRLFLGGTEVNAGTMQNAQLAALEAIRESLSEDADFLIYGCDFTGGEDGLAAAELLSTILDADIAASTDGTGHAALGGDWDLETEVGLIESEMLSLEGWNGLLAPITIVNTNNATTLANNIIGGGITLGTATYTGSAAQAGTFTGATGYTPEWLGYSSGIILTTGETAQVPGPNTNGGSSVNAPSAGSGADAGLTTLGGGTSFDASILDFTFTPTSNRVTMQFTFGSDEYNEYVYSNFNDAMGVWVNGVQVALTPTGAPISVNSVNRAGTFNPSQGNQANDPNPANGVFDSSNPNLYLNNEPGSAAYNTGMDGFTVTLSFVANVNIGVSNSIRIGIADIGDEMWDSWLFVREDSLTATTIAATDNVATAVNTPVVINALANDWDANGDPLTITHVLDKPITAGGPAVVLPSGSSVVLNLNGTLTFTPATGSTTDEVFTYTISDGTGSTAVGFINVDINQTPVNTVPAAQTTTEETSRTITGLSVADVDSTTLTTTLSLPAGSGTITVVTGGGATISGNGSGSVVISGTAAQINAAIGSITYAPTADFNTGSPAVPINLSIATTDGVSTDTDTVALTVTPVADIVADAISTTEDTARVFNAILGTNGASADNFENGGRVVSAVTQGANGSVTFLANGQITYTPNANFFGTDSFTYTVTSGGVTETATVTVNVSAVNDAPVNTVPAAQVATEDTNRIITGVSVADVDSTSLTTTLSIPVANGTLLVLTGGGATITGNGSATVTVSGTAAQINAAIASITYIPLADFNTATSFNLTVATSDGSITDTDTVGITVNAVSDIVADTVATNEDTAVVFNAITGTNGASADNFENAGRAITSVTQGANGSVTFLANGQITYTPNTNFFGTDSFSYTVTSGGITETATVTVNVAAVNDAPDAVDDDFAAGENDGPVVLGNAITSNDSDIDGDDLVAVVQTGVAGSAGGLFSIDEDGVVTFDANDEFEDLAVGETRETIFTYTIEDGEGGTDTATVTVTVSGANDAPVVTGLIGTQWNEDSESVSIDLSGFFSDADSSDDLIYTATGLPAGLSLDPDTGLLSGTIASSASASGPYTVEVTVNDGNGGLITQTFTWNVFNPAPVAANDDFSAGEDDAAAVVGNVLINDGDPDNDALSAQVASGGGSNGGQFTIAANGAVTFDADGDFDDLAVGETRETTFTYTLVDADGATSTAVITVTVTGANDAPLVIAGTTDRTDADSAVISLDTSVYFDDIDGSDVLTFTATGLPAGLSIDAATGIISGTIDSSASVGGPYSIEVTAEDGSGATAMHAFVWTVTNPAPIAVADEFTADEDDAAAVVGNALANDSDPDGDSYSAQVATGIAGSNGGVFSIAANGDVTFDPAGAFNSLEAGETAVTSFTYTLIDADGATTTATFTVEVTGENDAPVAVGTIATQSSTDAEVIAGLDLSGFFTDPDSGDVLTYSASGLPAGLTIDSATGVISGTIGASASVGGPYTVIVTATDENGALVTQSFSWQISNPGPLAENDDFTADEDDVAAVVGNAILNNDSDPDGDALSAVVQSGVAGTQGGLFSIAANGEVSFDPNGEFEDLADGETRTSSFTYTLVDADGATSTATVTVTVAGENDAPVTVGAINTQNSVDSASVSLDVSGFFADADTSDVVSFSASGLPSGLTIDGTTGVISGTIASSASASGPYTVDVTMSDGNGGSVMQTFTWNVSNPGPVANDDTFTALEDDGAAVVGNAITNNDTDPDSDALAAVAQTGVAGSNGGLFSINAAGEVSFDPNGEFEDLAAGENRSTTFTYTVADADGATSTATVTVVVTGENDAPETVGTISAQSSADSDTVTLNVSGTFTDKDLSDTVAYSASGLPTGLVIDAATGIISGTISSSASQDGPFTVIITATDESGAIATQSFTWTVSNPGPVANDDAFTALEDDGASVVGNAITNNDTDPDGDVLSAVAQTGVSGSNGGLFSIAADGTVSFDTNGEFEDLAAGETRETSFTYTLVDADGATSTATVTVTVTGENDTPVTVGTIPTQSSDDSEVISLGTSGFFADADASDVASYSVSGLPAGLTIDETTGVISGTIASSASASGPYTVVVTMFDGNGGSVTQTFTWNILNPGPVANDDTFSALEDSGVTVFGNAITNNDSDADGDALTAVAQTGVAGSSGGLFSIAGNGTVSFNTNGEFEDLAAGETRETSFTYTLVDADGAISSATVTVTVTGQNDAPVVISTIPTQSSNDSDVISLDTSGFFADADSSDVASFSASGLPDGLTIDEDTGVISGTVDSSASASGPYSVAVTMSDGNGGSVTQNFTWNVSNPGPIANDDAFTALEDDAATVVGNAITNNDSDPDGDALTAIVQAGVTGTSGGLFSIAADGQVTFDSNGAFEDLGAGETRETRFTYTLVDADGALSTATVTVTVTGANDSPVTVGTIAAQNSVDSATISLDVSSTFSDSDLTDTLVYSVTGLPAGLTIDSGTGIISGTIDSSASTGGPYDIEVTVADGNGGTTTQSFVWNVTNPGPVALNDEFSAGEDDAAGVVGNAITNNDSDTDGDLLSAIAQTVTGTHGGTFSIAANGEVSFDPAGAFEDLATGETRATSFTYTLLDADGATSTATVTVTVAGANDGPLTSGTILTQTNDDADSVSLDVSGSFSDPDGSDILTYTASGLPAGLTIDANTGIISGTIDASASVGGPYSVEVIANDGNGGTVSQFFSWVVNNPAPIAVDDAFTVNEDDTSAVIGNVITASDSDPDGDTIATVVQSGVAGSAGGLFSISATGEVTFDPNGAFDDLAEGESRETTFTYTLVDADGATSTAVVTVTVEGSNDTPVTVGTIPTQGNDDSDVVSLDVSGFFTDTDSSDVLEFSATGLPDGLSIDNATGIISGTIDSSASTGGPYTVVVTADDGNGGITTQTFTWNVSNPGPLAEDDGFASAESTSGVVGNALGNDSDPDNDDLTALVATGVAGTNGGLFSIAANGEVTFDPNGQFEDLAVGEPRTTSFTYTLVDADGSTSTATVTVTVTGENDIPVTVGTTADLSNDDSDVVTLDISGYFTDADGSDILTYTATGLPAGLSIDEDTGIISGAIDSSASAGGPYTVIVIANDGNGGTVSQTFSWSVNNPAPVAVDDAFAAGEDDAAAVLGNVIGGSDSDPDGDTIAVTAQSGVSGSNGGLFSVAANGDVSFDPNGQFEDLAADETRTTSFTYTLVDANGASDTATVTVTVTGVNDAPVTVGTIGNRVNNDSDVLTLDVSGFFTDADTTDTLGYSAVGLPDGLVISAGGVISGTITSSASSDGPYSVTVTAIDGNGGTVSQTFTWTVNNPAPVAVDDAFAAGEDDAASIVGNVISSSDSDPDGDTIAVTAQSGVAGSNGGLFSVSANGDVSFDPNGQFEDLAAGETRESSFTYTLVDADGASDTATVTVTVTGVNDVPVTVGTIAAQSNADSDSVALDVSGLFADTDATDALEFSATGLPAGLTIDPATGLISGTIASSASAGSPYTVEITVSDGKGGSVSQILTWTVSNPAPLAVDDFFTAVADDNAAIVGNVISTSDSDPDGDTIAVTSVTGVAGSNGGLFSIAVNGDVTFDPNGQFNDLASGETRTTSVTYTLVDADGETDIALITVTVTGANEAPVANGVIADQSHQDSEAITPLDLSGSFSDVDSSDTLTYSVLGLPDGLVIDANTGIISGTLDSSASAGSPHTVIVTANDGNGGTASHTFTWVVTNPGPVAVDDAFGAFEDDNAIVVGNAITSGDSDPDGDTLSALVLNNIAGSNGGLFSIAANGEVTFDANGDFESLAAGETVQTSFTYTVIDADGATATATIVVTVTGNNDVPFTVGTIADQANDDSDTVTVDVSGFFGDTDGSDVFVFSATDLPAGLVIDEATGVISGRIDSSASAGGPYVVVVTATDSAGSSTSQNFTWNVSNPGPVADDDGFAADEDDSAAVVGNVLVNDSDADGDALSVVAASGVAGSNGGIFSVSSTGEVTFDPNGAFESLALGETAVSTFTYTLVDADGATSTATVTVTITGLNDAPDRVGSIAAQTSADSDSILLDVSGSFSDADATDELEFSATGLPSGLVIDAVTGVISGTINSSASASGPYTVIVTATDGQGAAITQTFTWTVTNPAPIAGDDFFNATEDDAAAIVGNALANNDSDPDSDALEVVVLNNVAGSNGGFFSIAANGEVTFDSNGQFGDLAADEIRQTSFTYTLVDADGATSTATVTVDVAGANDVPVTVGTITTQNSLDSEVISLGTAGFFSDPDTSDVLTYSATGLPVGLTIDAATGEISGTIDSSASASGPYTVEVTATDEDGSAITQSFTWNVTNPGPVANDDNFTAVENVVGTVGNVITNNDTDPDDDALSVVAQNGVSGSDGGVFSIAANGEVSFDPNGEFDDLAFGESRTTSLTYTLVDADGATSTATVTITVTGANSAPFTVGTVPTQNNDDDDSVSLDLSGYFDDLDGSDVLAFSATGLPGGLTIDAATGVISGTIDSSASAAGPYTVEVTVIDGNGGTVSLNFTWNVTNPAPVAVDDTFVTDEDDSTAVVGNVIVGSDSDPDGDLLAVQVLNLVAGSEGGLFSIAANGDVTFDPNGEFEDLAAGETRETSLTYTLVDADGATSTATVTITVTGANDAPVTVGTVAAQSSIDGETIAPINLAVHFDDVDHGAVLSYSASGLPTGLVMDSVTGIISGTIHSSASQDGPFNVIITASDGLGGSVTQSFVWTVTNPAPVANDDAFTAQEDSGLTVVGNAITNNDSDPDNDALSAVAGTDIAGSEGGLFSIAANGEVSFDPNGEFEDLAVGETRETSFTYTLVDADGATSTATVTVTVTGANDAPVSVGSITTQSSVDSAVISLATSAFFADADASDVPSYSATGLPIGLVIDGTTGVISGTINSSASVAGPYTVVVTMADGNGGSTTQTFSWIVSNPAPLAQDDAFTALEDDAAAVVGNAITNNDSDPDSDALTAVAATGVAGSDGGLFSINAAGEVSFDANGDFEDLAAGETRTTTFTYTVVDADGASAQATVTVEVTGENDAPENVGVIGTQVSVDSDVVTLDVSGFFSDKDLSDTLSYTATGLPAGLVIDAATGIISGTIDSSASQDGPFSVLVTAADGEGGSVTQTFIWTVSNPAPIANDDAFGVSEDDSLAVIGNVITAGDSDPDGDSLSVVAGSNIAGSHGGLFSIAANGDVSFDPNGAFEDLATGETRTTSLTYTLVDADGATATATVTVTVMGMNDAPTTVGSIATRSNADSDVIAPFDVTGFFADADLTDVMEYSATGLPSGLTIDAATGIISGTIASSASTGGPYSVTVTASDGNGGSVEQIFTWLVSNPAPNAVNDTYGIGEDDAATVLGNVIGNDVDPDGDALSVVAVSGAAGSEGGLFTINGTGEVSFDPNGAFEVLAAGETRETSYTYTLVDADGATSQATVTVTVTGANDAPVRIGSVPAQVSEDSDAVMLNVSGAFGDMDASDVLRYSASGLPAGLSINEETGVISGTIDSSASASGPYTVVVTVDDDHGGTTTQTFTWTVTNPGPVAVDDSFVADEDAAAAIVGNAITGSDSDPDSDAVSAQVQSGVAGSHGGLFSIAANGDVTFDPNGAFEDLAAGETRETSFVYTLTDADGATTSATVTVTVTGENDAPVGNGSIATRNSIDGEIISLDLSGFFSDPDVSDVLSYSATGLPSGLSIDPVTGIISGTIDTSASAAGPYTAVVTAQDASGMFVSLSFTWNVTNPVPVAQGDAFAAGEDDASLVVGNVLGNDSDPDNDTLTVVPVNQLAGSTGGLFTIDAAGNVTFSPDGDFEDLAAGETRETSVSYTLVDADGATATATITVAVTGANDAPVVTLVLPNQSHQDSELIVPINTAVAFADADAGDSLVYSVSGLPAGLVFDIHTGIISGTLHSSASLGGPYLVHVTATDESGESVTASFTWTVMNPAPVANNDQSSGGSGNAGFGAAGNDQFSAFENDLVVIVGNALDNDLDPDGDDLSAVAEENISGSHGGIFSIATNGEVTFDPAGQFEDLAVGETRETSFTYSIIDADGGTATAVVTVTVTGSNDAPVVTNLISDQEDADGTPVSVDASVFFSDPDLSDTLRFSATGLPSGLTIDEETGVISGTIDHDASGDGPFTVEITATDENGEEVTMSFVWTVTNPAPVAVNDHFNVSGTAATVALGNVIAGGDSDPDGDVLSVVPQSDVAGTGGGLFHIDADGNVTFDPNGAFANLLGGQSRETSFTYTLIDADGATSTATVTVKVTAANAPPVPQSEVITVDAGTRGESLGLRAPVDPDGDVVTITVTKLPKKGVLRLPNGKAVSRGQVLSASQLENLVFDAPEDYKGKKPVIFRYMVTDGQVTNHAKVRIKILKGKLWVTCYSVTQKK